jgi:integration host factor subunit alpha
MVKADIVKCLAEKLDDITQAQASDYLETILETIKKTLSKGDDVMISGFGKFSVRDKKARMGRDPHTGGKLLLEARRVITFKPSQLLRAVVNHGDKKS